jgi:hypothetical protein
MIHTTSTEVYTGRVFEGFIFPENIDTIYIGLVKAKIFW